MSLIAMAQSAHDSRSPIESSMSISRGSGRGEISRAASTSRSVVLPRAESTATTRRPLSRAATIRLAARFSSSVPATEVPPNFITTIPSPFEPLMTRASIGQRLDRSSCDAAHVQQMYRIDISVAMELSATGKVILGMLAARPRSGYEIKQLVDNSARFFWAASYGQIYPELKRLENAGLIAGADASQGARQRTVYKLSAKGRRAAREWISRAPEVIELRDEGLLELFFAGSIDPARTPAIARERAAHANATAKELRSLEREIEDKLAAEGPEFRPDAGSLTVLRYGIELNEWSARWFERAADELERDAARETA